MPSLPHTTSMSAEMSEEQTSSIRPTEATETTICMLTNIAR
jgi:hypothetical protein